MKKLEPIVFIICVLMLVGGALLFTLRKREPAPPQTTKSSNQPITKSPAPQSDLSAVALAKEEIPNPQSDGLLRIITPVRLTRSLGPDLATEVAEARKILTHFQRAGFTRAIWAVSELPAKDEDIKPWLDQCLQAFPTPPILALDRNIKKDGSITLPDAKLQTFLKLALKPTTPNAGGASRRRPLSPSGEVPNQEPTTIFHSVILNYTHLHNEWNIRTADNAITTVTKTAKHIRTLSPDTFQWLLVAHTTEYNPGKKVSPPRNLDKWLKPLSPLVDGFYLHAQHDWRIGKEAEFAEAAAPLLCVASGKPVLRGGFRYSSARPRPGIAKELRKNYRWRVETYEKWLKDGDYAGYARLIGESVPTLVSANMRLLPGDS